MIETITTQLRRARRLVRIYLGYAVAKVIRPVHRRRHHRGVSSVGWRCQARRTHRWTAYGVETVERFRWLEDTDGVRYLHRPLQAFWPAHHYLSLAESVRVARMLRPEFWFEAADAEQAQIAEAARVAVDVSAEYVDRVDGRLQGLDAGQWKLFHRLISESVHPRVAWNAATTLV